MTDAEAYLKFRDLSEAHARICELRRQDIVTVDRAQKQLALAVKALQGYAVDPTEYGRCAKQALAEIEALGKPQGSIFGHALSPEEIKALCERGEK